MKNNRIFVLFQDENLRITRQNGRFDYLVRRLLPVDERLNGGCREIGGSSNPQLQRELEEAVSLGLVVPDELWPRGRWPYSLRDGEEMIEVAQLESWATSKANQILALGWGEGWDCQATAVFWKDETWQSIHFRVWQTSNCSCPILQPESGWEAEFAAIPAAVWKRIRRHNRRIEREWAAKKAIRRSELAAKYGLQ